MNKKQKEYFNEMSNDWKKFYNYFRLTRNDSQFILYKYIVDKMFETDNWVDIRLRKVQADLIELLTVDAIYLAIKGLAKNKEIIRLKIKDKKCAWYIALPDVNTVVKNNNRDMPFLQPDKRLMNFLERIQEKSYNIINSSDIFNLAF